MTVIKVLAFILSLGIDTLMMSVALGASSISRATRIKVAAAFTVAEALMPLVGVTLGYFVGGVLGHWSSFVGALALIAVALWFILYDHDPDADEARLGALGLWSIAGMALSISIDEIAAGFSIGLIGIPVALTIVLIAIQALIFSLTGLALGKTLKPYLGDWAEKLAGIVLGLLGISLLIQVVPILF